MRRIVALCSMAMLAACVSSGPPGYPSAPPPRLSSASFASRVLVLHNAERARVGVPPLTWDPVLAASAKDYAARLASLRRPVHSSKSERGPTGENLVVSPRGIYSLDTLLNTWLDERRNFRPGIFPRNSRTGNWVAVGHYTALIWPTTTRVGCGMAAVGAYEALVCRYAPGGNIDGRRVP